MTRTSRWLGALALMTAASLAAVTPAASGHDGGNAVDRVDLPNGWQPEGVTTDGHRLYVGSLADGAIYQANPRTGEGKVLATGETGRVAVGVDYDKRRDLLWVAGGPTGQVRAQSAKTGEVVATYDFPSATPRFLNDLVVTKRGVYATDSSNQELAVIPFAKHAKGHDGGHGRHRGHGHADGLQLPPATAATTLPLTGDLVYTDGFNLNGIVSWHKQLVSVQSNTGLLFAIDGRTGVTEQIDLGGATVVNGDGLEPGDGVLYVVQNQDNKVAVVDLGRHLDRGGSVVAELTSPDLDVPATAALVGHNLYLANARFTTPPTPDTAYWLTRLDAVRD